MLYNQFGLERSQVLPLAGFGLAAVAKELLDSDLQDRPVVVLVGIGDKGCAGLIAARHLHNRGAWVQILCSDAPEHFTGLALAELSILRGMDVPLAWAEDGWELPPCDLVLDGITDAESSEPTGMALALIELANSSVAPIVSFDFPSGLDPWSGEVYSASIRAVATVAGTLPRQSILVQPGNQLCGEVYLVDVGAPLALYGQLGIDLPPLFGQNTVLRTETVGDEGQVAVL